MDNTSARRERPFHNLTVPKPQMHLLDKPSGFASAVAKTCLGHQMRYSVEELERKLESEGCPHVLQLVCEGDSRKPDRWALYADGECVADGDGDFAYACFTQSADKFLKVLADAVHDAHLARITEDDYRMLSASRKIARIEKMI